MAYKVIYTQQARNEITGYVDYILDVFHNRTAAYKKALILDSITDTLAQHPHLSHPYDGLLWHDQQLYAYLIDVYQVLHIPDDAKKTVTVIRVLHAGQDLATQLSRTKTI